jgi:hypothetical protein
MNLNIHMVLFRAALDDLALDADLANMCLEITTDDDGFEASRFPIPRTGPYARKA